MRRYSEAVQSDVRKGMSPPHRQSVAQANLGGDLPARGRAQGNAIL